MIISANQKQYYPALIAKELFRLDSREAAQHTSEAVLLKKPHHHQTLYNKKTNMEDKFYKKA